MPFPPKHHHAQPDVFWGKAYICKELDIPPLIFESIKVFISTKQFREIRKYYLLLYMRFIFRVMVIQVELICRSLYMHGVGILLYFNYKEISDGILFRGKLSSSMGRDYLHRAFQNMALILVGSHFPTRMAV